MEILVAVIWHLPLFFQENSRTVSRITQQPFPFQSVSSKAYCFTRNVLLVCKITYKYHRDDRQQKAFLIANSFHNNALYRTAQI